MDPQDMSTINSSVVFLTTGDGSLDLNEGFMKLLLQYKIFNPQMIEDILKNDNPKLQLCLMLVHRGPTAFERFLSALKETKQYRVIRALAETRSRLNLPPLPIQWDPDEETVDQNMNGNPSPVSPRTAAKLKKVLEPANYSEPPPSPLQSRTVTDANVPNYSVLNIKVKPAVEFRGAGPEGYPNRCIKPRGLALILNYHKFVNTAERVGSEKDVIHLDQLLQQLGYTVTIRTNLTLVETSTELNSFASCPDHERSDSTIVAIMSHGKDGSQSQGTLIYTSDGRFIPSEDVLCQFNNSGCPLLKGKPKIFLFQFCRGDNINEGLRSPPVPLMIGRTVTDGNPVQPTPTLQYERSFDDMLIAYSTLPGYVSYREESEGTWFIKALCLIFMEEACVYHVDRLLQRVDELVKCWTGLKNGKQTLEIARRGFNRKFYFNPGLWTEQ